MQDLQRANSSICLRAVGRFTTWISARPGRLKFFASFVLFAVLLTPSIWMLSVISPLWRDIDAYVQVTQPPGPGTILQYGPLYCFVARIPLYFGYAIDSLGAGGPLPTFSFFIHPILTDSGVFSLVLSQHVALCFATFYFIAVTTRLFWVRLILAVAWAANPLFYAFAHCVGSETLGLILVLLIGATGLRIVRYSHRVPKNKWVLFGILLWLCMLTRHVNVALAGLLALTFLLTGAYRFIMIGFARSQLLRHWQRSGARRALQNATFAVAVGVSCIVLANVSLQALCYAAKTPYYSTIGPTFPFRLKFLAALPIEKRNELLDKVSNHTDSADVKKLISLLRNSFSDETPSWDVTAFKEKAQATLFSPQADPREEKFNLVLNRTAKAFLWPPREIYLRAVGIDCRRSQEITIPDVVSFLFVTTRFYFSHAAAMPQCASLVTFRYKNADQIFAIFRTHSYFHHPKDVSHLALSFFWLISLAVFVVMAKMRQQEAAGLASYTVALTLVGLFMILGNCFLTVFQPRFTLPMWELTIISVSILSGKAMEYVLAGAEQQQKHVPC